MAKRDVNIRLRISGVVENRVHYALTCLPSEYSSFADDSSYEAFYKSLFVKGLEIALEEMVTGREREPPLTISPTPVAGTEEALIEHYEMFNFSKEHMDRIRRRIKSMHTIELRVDTRVIDDILDYTNSLGERWSNNSPLPQTVSESLLLKGLNEVGREAWNEARRRNK